MLSSVARPQEVPVTLATGRVIIFRWSRILTLYVCGRCQGGLLDPADCWRHAEAAHGADRP
jgi:hypothetical protein